jgi:hypothetical protein
MDMKNLNLLFFLIVFFSVAFEMSADLHNKGNKREHEVRRSDAETVTSHWPHLAGRHVDEVEKAIKSERPDLKVYKVPHDAMVTMDFRTDRVRLFVDGEGKVSKTPRVG